VFKRLVSVVVCVFIFSLAKADQMNSAVLFKDGWQWAPDGWLLASAGRGWWYDIQPSPFPMDLQRRSPAEEEQKIISKASEMFEKGPGKALALLDGREVKGEFFKPDVGPKSTFFGFSMGKTVTAMGVGKALCSNALTMETRVDALIPQMIY
jgi:CubicO group peptidase (beta-lactamase class C family)